MKTVERAISESVHLTATIHITDATLDNDAVTHADVRDALVQECEDSAETDVAEEFWGTTEDGGEWRVHLEHATGVSS